MKIYSTILNYGAYQQGVNKKKLAHRISKNASIN
jgi:hypothetical protein